ncbi:MAG: hypothetical protein CSA33_04360 [Desulfobulbus propionicus]|nr:MAG: hypothetical protein CSA33_04360 [Desulfobulbus propionicus]
MKIKSAILLTISAVLVLYAQAVSAHQSCPEVIVVQAGAASTGCDGAVLLTNVDSAAINGWPAYTNRWFCFDKSSDRSDAMLAVALVAMTQKTVAQVCPSITGVFTDWAQINQMWVTGTNY